MANAFEGAGKGESRIGTRSTSRLRELLDSAAPAVERAPAKFEAAQNVEAILKKIQDQGKLGLLTNVAVSGQSPAIQPPDAKLNTLSASIGERLVWLAGRIIWGFAAAAWLLVPYVALKLAGVPLPF